MPDLHSLALCLQIFYNQKEPGHTVDLAWMVTYGGGAQQRGHSEHEHADPEGESDVLHQRLEHHDDAGVVGADADPEHDCGHNLPREAGPELGHKYRDGVEEEHGGGQVESLGPEPVQDRTEHDLPDKVTCAHHAEQDARVLRADAELELRPVCHEGVGGEDS